MNFIITSDDVSGEGKFLSALNASSESFVHKALKDEQQNAFIESYAMGEMFWPCYRRDYRQERYISIQLISKVLFRLGRTANTTSKTAAELLVFCWLSKWNGTFTKFCFWNLLIANETGGRVLQNKPYICRALYNSRQRSDFR